MSILTGIELEFLASLRTSWPRLYRNELERLLKEDGNLCTHQLMGERGVICARFTEFCAVAPRECPGIAEAEPASRRS
jgi:hypothetical protein